MVLSGVLAVVAVACALWLGRAHYAIGLDMQGGALVLVHPTSPGADLDALARRITRTLALSSDQVRVEGDEIAISIDGADQHDVDQLVTKLQPRPIAIYEPESLALGREAHDRKGLPYRIHAEAALTGLDIASSEPAGTSVVVKLTASGASKLADLSLRALGKPLVIMLGDEVISAPVVTTQIVGGEFTLDVIDPGIAAELTASAIPPVEIRSISVIAPNAPAWTGRPLAVVVTSVAALLWIATLLTRRRGLAILGAGLLGWTVAVVELLRIGGTLTFAVYTAGLLVAAPIAFATARASRARFDRPVARWLSAWPAAVWLLALFVLSLIVSTQHHASTRFVALPLWHGVRFAQRVIPWVVVLGLVSAIATPLAGTEHRPRAIP